MHSLDPFVPWEWGKYYAIFSVILLLFTNKLVLDFPFFLGLLMIITTLTKGNTEWKLVFFNAIISMALLLMWGYFKKIAVTQAKFLLVIKYAFLVFIVFLLSSISLLSDFKPEEFELDSQFVLDEIPANQIATYMGLGFFLAMSLFKERIRLLFGGSQAFLVLGIGMLMVGVISFSRGGVVVAILGVILLYFGSLKTIFSFKYFKQVLIWVPILLLLAIYVNNKTNGTLFLRYSGETKGTLFGTKQKGINTLTTERYAIMLGDLQTFSKNWILGVEVGKSLKYRPESEHQYSHLEFSRLLAEHGIIGIMTILIFVQALIIMKSMYFGNLKLAFYIVGFLTTFHGATRTSVPLVLMLLALVKFEKK